MFFDNANTPVANADLPTSGNAGYNGNWHALVDAVMETGVVQANVFFKPAGADVNLILSDISPISSGNDAFISGLSFDNGAFRGGTATTACTGCFVGITSIEANFYNGGAAVDAAGPSHIGGRFDIMVGDDQAGAVQAIGVFGAEN